MSRPQPILEELARAMFERETLASTGNKWDWSKAGDDVQARYIVKAAKIIEFPSSADGTGLK